MIKLSTIFVKAGTLLKETSISLNKLNETIPPVLGSKYHK